MAVNPTPPVERVDPNPPVERGFHWTRILFVLLTGLGAILTGLLWKFGTEIFPQVREFLTSLWGWLTRSVPVPSYWIVLTALVILVLVVLLVIVWFTWSRRGKGALSQLQSENQELSNRISEEQKAAERARTICDEYSDQLEHLKAQNGELLAEIEALKNDLDARTQDTERFRADVAQLEFQLNELGAIRDPRGC